jgi:DNA-binding transcriptional MerR regulator
VTFTEAGRDPRRRARSITIGELAKYAGVTIKAVRHYHSRGLLDEPPRDSSGYRRYTADHAVKLIKIRTLAEGGVPLARIKELLVADPARFAAAVPDIDRGLQKRARDLAEARRRLKGLVGGDRLFVSAGVAACLDRLREIGVSDRRVELERQAWILMQAVAPQDAELLLADRRAALADPEFCAIYLLHDQAYDWLPDDPRLRQLAERTALWLIQMERREGELPIRDRAVAQLLLSSAAALTPAIERLAELTRKAIARCAAGAESPGR